jgi:hypothetical protein
LKTPENPWFAPILLPQRSQGAPHGVRREEIRQLPVRYRDPLGRQRSETFGRKADAERFLREIQVEIDRGRSRSTPAEMRLAQWAEEFLSLTRRLSPLTQEAYRRDIDKYLPAPLPFLPDRTPSRKQDRELARRRGGRRGGRMPRP